VEEVRISITTSWPDHADESRIFLPNGTDNRQKADDKTEGRGGF
jgi:hypothetical protein